MRNAKVTQLSTPTLTKHHHEALAQKGIKIIHATPILATSGESIKGYAVSDNGTIRVWTYSQVMALAN